LGIGTVVEFKEDLRIKEFEAEYQVVFSGIYLLNRKEASL
jgi:hypothetical protein